MKENKIVIDYTNYFLTYEEWLTRGYHVRKGSKAKYIDQFGLFLFSKDQTSTKRLKARYI
jgi:hypothetical protein